MQVKIIEERGYESALRGMSYSFKDEASDVETWWVGQFPRAEKRAPLLAPKEGGHNGFLESIAIWIDVQAARAWWSEMDRYRVGKTQQSGSTMHTLAKRNLTQDDFEEGTLPEIVAAYQKVWENTEKSDINTLKMNLPEGFLQRRIICTNYKVLRNIIQQRKDHRLKWWQVFVKEVMAQVEHPELLQDLFEGS